ncbi:fluoride efflux transporter FluC [Streptomyces palmae]|uniref:Fluoride-specific ion channel FluC n=1 Tax=Streptomyces palmae TaxID=1701085 RepID=A0A4Z0H8B2_9ACTN|nr:CrcB family protein [Streptomyces palmae]TGB12349.1 CrcB family protein [Streptomyces palmae]
MGEARAAPRSGPDTGADRRAVRRGPSQWPVVAAVSVGGGLGTALRYGVSLLWPLPPDAFPWATLAVNATGCAVMGVFMVVITEVWAAHRLVRPFFGTGVLGGYTTFSAYAADIRRLALDGHPGSALADLLLTVATVLAAVAIAAALTRRALEGRRR